MGFQNPYDQAKTLEELELFDSLQAFTKAYYQIAGKAKTSPAAAARLEQLSKNINTIAVIAQLHLLKRIADALETINKKGLLLS